jgi:hypothetical protein
MNNERNPLICDSDESDTSSTDQTYIDSPYFSLLDRINWFVHSSGYYIFSIIMICISVMILTWTWIRNGHPRDVWFIIFEAIITIFLLLEVCLRWYIKGFQYLRGIMNVIDLTLVILCILSFIGYIVSIHNSWEEELEEIADAVLMVFRYAVQLLRLLVIIKGQYERNSIRSDPAHLLVM